MLSLLLDKDRIVGWKKAIDAVHLKDGNWILSKILKVQENKDTQIILGMRRVCIRERINPT